jgi:uncharacterized protein YbbC (DUF1343 family)
MAEVLTGIDVLARDGLKALAGASVGLITNHTGLTREGIPTIDVLHAAPNLSLKALFGPEHGIRGALDERVADGKDEKTGLPIYSLYGERQEPTDAQLVGLDTLVFDIQDIGCRFYTYLSTMGHCLQVAAKKNLKFVVLDRPNPIGGLAVEGPLADETRLSFTAFHPIPVRHGMTLGELALLLNSQGKRLNAKLTVVKCEGWKRADLWDATGLTWVNPSPNMRSLTQALLYPGVGLVEFTNLSVGRGTDTPFEWIGAPWLDGRALASALNAASIPGLRVYPVRFTPRASKFEGKLCQGVNFVVTDRLKFPPLRLGMELAFALRKLHLKDWEASKLLTLLANRSAMDAVLAGEEPLKLVRSWSAELKAFNALRGHFLLYG